MISIRFLVALILFFGNADFGTADNIRPKVIPRIDLVCFASQFVSYATNLTETGLDGDNLGTPRYAIRSVGDRILKVVQFPQDEAKRKEQGFSLYNISVDREADPRVFAWREDTPARINISSLHVSDGTFVVIDAAKPGTFPVSTHQTYKCRSP